MVQVNEEGKNYYMIKKKENYLNFPNKMNTYEGLDSIFISAKVVATLLSPLHIKFTTLSGEGTSFKDLKLKN